MVQMLGSPHFQWVGLFAIPLSLQPPRSLNFLSFSGVTRKSHKAAAVAAYGVATIPTAKSCYTKLFLFD